MAIDFNAEMAKIVARWGNETVAGYLAPNLLLEKVVHHGDMDDFRTFFKRYAMSGRKWKNFKITEYDSIFGPKWMARFEPAHLKWIYHLLSANDTLLKCTLKLAADRRIAVERRALCFHAVFSAQTHLVSAFGELARPQFWWYNRAGWQAFLYLVRRGDDDAFLKRLGCTLGPRYAISDALRHGAESDSISIFEMNREFENRQVCDSLLQFLIRCNAAKCFTYLLANYPKRVFKLRSPQEWLLTVCRCAKDELAAAAVVELERQFPGLVASTRDPWGGTPLWSTFCESGPKEKLRAELIRFGCDPDEENEIGLSYRLLIDNAPAAVC